MDIVTLVYCLDDGWLWTTLNVLWWSSKIYATTGRMLFYLLCRIISENYVNIRKEIELIKSSVVLNVDVVSDRLTTLSHQHLLVCQCVDKLNESFGLILLIEITYIFINEINSAMYLLTTIYTAYWLWLPICVLWNIYTTVNFTIICFASNGIKNEVSYDLFIQLSMKKKIY